MLRYPLIFSALVRLNALSNIEVAECLPQSGDQRQLQRFFHCSNCSSSNPSICTTSRGPRFTVSKHTPGNLPGHCRIQHTTKQLQRFRIDVSFRLSDRRKYDDAYLRAEIGTMI